MTHLLAENNGIFFCPTIVFLEPALRQKDPVPAGRTFRSINFFYEIDDWCIYHDVFPLQAHVVFGTFSFK
jgi:hypothetical protein